MLLEKNKPDPVRKNPIQKVFNLYSNLNGINHSMMFFLFDCQKPVVSKESLLKIIIGAKEKKQQL